MTAPTLTLDRGLDGDSLARRLTPSEGWATLAATALLAMCFGWSLDDAGWIPSLQGPTSYLPWVALLGTIVGVACAKAGLGRLRTDLVGSIIGGLLLPFIAGSILLGAQNPSLGIDDILARYRAAALVVVHVYDDLVVNGQPFTTQFGHYHMIFAGLVFAAGLLAANAAVGRHRPLDAVVVTGLLLLTNEAITAHEQLPILVLFSLAAMTLLIRSHVFEEQLTWARRRIGDPSTVSTLYLRGGAMFIGIAVLGALLLTGTASSAPLQGLWHDMPRRFADLIQLIQRLGPGGGQTHGGGSGPFGSSETTTGIWSPDPDSVAFTAKLPANDTQPYKWRAGTYATYTLNGWTWGPTHSFDRQANDPLLKGTGDDPTLDVARTDVRIEITPEGFFGSSVLSPQSISWVDRPATVTGVGDVNRFTTVDVDGGGTYTVDALVPNLKDKEHGLTENRLRAAGRSYPSDIQALYLAVPANAIGTAAQRILDTVENRLGGKDAAESKPYDLARAMEAYLSSSDNFTYQTNVQSDIAASCDRFSTVECFAVIKKGYCEYYASEMAILLRKAGIPTRIAYGYLPGLRDPNTGVETVTDAARHWWVEVYFPGSGWVEFDPTGGGQGRPQELQSGAPVTPPPPIGSSGINDRETDQIRRSGSTGGGTTLPRSTGSGPFAIVAVLLFAAIVLVGLIARRRAPRKPMHPDQAWGGLGRLATRFGFGPHPQQTVYEYAGALGEVLPAARVEVTTVARAKVEVAYGRRQLGEDRLRTVGDAYRRLRLAVLRAGIGRRLGRPFRRFRR